MEIAKISLELARAVRVNVERQERYLQSQIEEAEVVLKLLRRQAESVAVQLQQADKQLGGASSLLYKGINPNIKRHLTMKPALMGKKDKSGDEMRVRANIRASTRRRIKGIESEGQESG